MLASRPPNEGHIRPNVGDKLMVIHDFIARSSDELSLAKGDRVELIERDDEFGDGWFLGRHIANGNTGLFPEVYTRMAVRPSSRPASNIAPKPSAPVGDSAKDGNLSAVAAAPSKLEPLAEQPTQTPPTTTLSQIEKSAALPPLNSGKPDSTAKTAAAPGSPEATLGRFNNPSQDSQVLNDTLNVINEHITDLRFPASNGALRAPGNDSGSEYSANIDSRMSYIAGEETDEEEEHATLSRAEVESWTADDVAEYLFTNGVEQSHCEVFRDQEITGEVLLGMDQSSLFIKALDLGSVGRRLKTWQRIKAVQDEVAGSGTMMRRTTQNYGSEAGSEDARRNRSRTSTLNNSISNRPMSVQTRRLSMSQTPKASPTAAQIPASPNNRTGADSVNVANHNKRPSAASVRDMNNSRRHSSSYDFRVTGTSTNPSTPKLAGAGTFPLTSSDSGHKKQASFDRTWTLGTAQRPLSSTGLQDIIAASEGDIQDSAVDLDRGYFSGTEADGRKRNVLRKRESATGHAHSPSYAEEQRVRSATALSRHSRFGSMDSFRDSAPSPAAQKYYGLQPGSHRRTASANTVESVRPPPPAKDPAPTVTRLDGSAPSEMPSPSSGKQKGMSAEWLASVVTKPIGRAGGALGLRAVSDGSRARKNPVEPPPKDHPLPSPAHTGSSTPSAGPSFEMDSPDAAKASAAMMSSRSARRKGKKETSAYTKGLLNISPRQAMQEAEYSGWMKKKSSNLMTPWKPRLFVLKGRRLAYYYSEDDTQERGLIDISFHRVLPADNEKLHGLHATITGAVAHPSSLLPGSEAREDVMKGDESMFIFKLVPPRAGLSRAVNFTKPTVHYFAVPSLQQGRLWMAALMKATIDRDETQKVTTSYQQKTISLAKAKQMRSRPPALMNLDEATEEELKAEEKKDSNGLGIFSEADSGVSGMDKLKVESSKLNLDFGSKDASLSGA